jgi:hypothetical protein
MDDIEIDPETGMFIGLEGMVFKREFDLAALRGAACPRCGRAPTHVRPVSTPTPEGRVWLADPRPNCWTPGCNARTNDGDVDRTYYDFRVKPTEEFGVRPPTEHRPA